MPLAASCFPVSRTFSDKGCQIVYFQTKNSKFDKLWRALCGLDNVYIFYGHLEYFTVIWTIFWPFGTFCVNLVHFAVLLSCTKKNLATPSPTASSP
jgi:hypothetical protein